MGNKSRGDSREEKLKKALTLREELHRRMFEHFFRDSMSTDDIFKDMDPLFEDSLSGFSEDFIDGRSSQFEMSWTESSEGRSLLIRPKNKDQKFEINVENGMIQLKGKSETKSEYGTSVSSFSQSYSVPSDCDWKNVKIVEKQGNILLSFPFLQEKIDIPKTKKPMKNEDRLPLKPSHGDIEV